LHSFLSGNLSQEVWENKNIMGKYDNDQSGTKAEIFELLKLGWKKADKPELINFRLCFETLANVYNVHKFGSIV